MGMGMRWSRIPMPSGGCTIDTASRWSGFRSCEPGCCLPNGLMCRKPKIGITIMKLHTVSIALGTLFFLLGVAHADASKPCATFSFAFRVEKGSGVIAVPTNVRFCAKGSELPTEGDIRFPIQMGLYSAENLRCATVRAALKREISHRLERLPVTVESVDPSCSTLPNS